jgi:hypothetical protein
MTDLGPVAWPPAPIRTDRLVLRQSEARDRPAVVEWFASPDVGTYVGVLNRAMSLSARCRRCPGAAPAIS